LEADMIGPVVEVQTSTAHFSLRTVCSGQDIRVSLFRIEDVVRYLEADDALVFTEYPSAQVVEIAVTRDAAYSPCYVPLKRWEKL
jgi:hypothetical protein